MGRALLLLLFLSSSVVHAAGPTFRARDMLNEYFSDAAQATSACASYTPANLFWFPDSTFNFARFYPRVSNGTIGPTCGNITSPPAGARYQCPSGSTLSAGDMCTCDAATTPVVDASGLIACGTASTGGGGSVGSATYGGPLQGTGLGSAMFMLTCEPDASLSQSVAPCPSADGTHTKPVMHDAYVLDYDAGATLAPLSQPFDYSKAAAFWGLAFSSVFVWWLFGQGMGQFLGIAKRAGRS